MGMNLATSIERRRQMLQFQNRLLRKISGTNKRKREQIGKCHVTRILIRQRVTSRHWRNSNASLIRTPLNQTSLIPDRVPGKRYLYL
jgi:hypothetical protein